MNYLFSLEEIVHGQDRLTQEHLDALDPITYAAVVEEVNDWFQTRQLLKAALKVYGDDLKPMIESRKAYFQSKMRFGDATRTDFTLAVLSQLLEESK